MAATAATCLQFGYFAGIGIRHFLVATPSRESSPLTSAETSVRPPARCGLSDFAHAGSVAKRLWISVARRRKGENCNCESYDGRLGAAGDKPATLALTFRTLSTLSGQAAEGLQDCDDPYREPPPRRSLPYLLNRREAHHALRF